MLRRCLQGSSLLSLSRGWLGTAGSSAHDKHSLAQMTASAGLDEHVQDAVRSMQCDAWCRPLSSRTSLGLWMRPSATLCAC